MAALTTEVEQNLSKVLLDPFALVFDGKTTLEAHHVAVFASYSSEKRDGYRSAFLVMSALENKATHNAERHVGLLHLVLRAFGKEMQNLVVLVGDSCNVSRNVSIKTAVPLIGYFSYRLQLPIRKIMS